MTYDSTVLADSPWGYWKTDETSGTTLTDSSGNARTATIVQNAPTLAQTGPAGNADAEAWPNVPSTASGDRSHAITSATLGTSTSVLSVECWFKLAATPTTATAIAGVCYGATSTSARQAYLFVDTDGKIKFWWGNTSTSGLVIASASAVSTGGWHHAVGVLTATTGKIRLDKADVASGSQATLIDTSGQFIIHSGGVKAGFADLRTSDAVRVSKPALYLSTLSDARIDAHYDAMIGGTTAGGAAALTLSGSGGVAASTGGTGALALSGSGTAGATVGGTGALDLSATGAVVGPMPAAGTGALSLSASGAVSAVVDGTGSLTLSGSGAAGAPSPAAGSGALTLSGTGTAVGPLAAAGTGALDLSGSSSVAATAAGSGSLTFSGVGAALATFLTDLSNVLSGRRRGGLGVVTYEPPFVAPPATIVLASKVDKARALPVPTLVNGRPT